MPRQLRILYPEPLSARYPDMDDLPRRGFFAICPFVEMTDQEYRNGQTYNSSLWSRDMLAPHLMCLSEPSLPGPPFASQVAKERSRGVPVKVKLLRPPRQSRGNSQVGLGVGLTYNITVVCC